MNTGIRISQAEIHDLTKYKLATKQLGVLHERGFTRAYIDRDGEVVLERSHYEAVTRGELHKPSKRANLNIFRPA